MIAILLRAFPQCCWDDADATAARRAFQGKRFEGHVFYSVKPDDLHLISYCDGATWAMTPCTALFLHFEQIVPLLRVLYVFLCLTYFHLKVTFL